MDPAGPRLADPPTDSVQETNKTRAALVHCYHSSWPAGPEYKQLSCMASTVRVQQS